MSDYTLALSAAEVDRYRLMAERAHTLEAAQWDLAGIAPGARVADVGCGPAAVTVLLAEAVGDGGSVVGVERDPGALAQAAAMVEATGATNVELRQGDATNTGLPEGRFDVVMMRHVLAHNGGHEQDIVDHLTTLVRPGGCVFLLDVDLTAARDLGMDPELHDVQDRYAEFHQRRGNDPAVGLRLATLLSGAGLDVLEHSGRISILTPTPGVRPPAWAARDAMLEAGVVTKADVARWQAAFERADAGDTQPTIFIPQYIGVGRRPE